MNRSVRNLLVFMFLLSFGSPDFTRALSPQSGSAKPQITVRLYNYAEAPRGTLQHAREVASGVFDKIGVGVKWLNCYSPDSQQQLDPACSEATTPTTLQLRIAARSTNAQISGFGIALPALDGGFSKHATVFRERVEELVTLEDSTRVAVLGHIMVHEIGHLLLGPGSHSSEGIMRFPWTKIEVGLADKGWLRFTQHQAERIRAEVRIRIRGDVLLFGLPFLADASDQESTACEGAPSARVGQQARDAAPAGFWLSILLFNYAEVGPAELEEAKANTALIFRRAGIDVEWRLFSQRTGAPNPQGQDASGRRILPLNLILPSAAAYPSLRKQMRLPKTALGFALTQPDGTARGDTVYIFVNQVDELVRRERFARVGAILGPIIAHELGHLLLGRGHAPSGLMSAEVGALTVRLAGANALHFTRKQAKSLRAAMEERAIER